MKSYLDLTKDVLDNGRVTLTRAVDPKTGARLHATSVFGRMWRHYLDDGFPLLTTKRMPLRFIAEELFWMLRGEGNIKSLQAQGVPIWNQWAYDPDQKFGGRLNKLSPSEVEGDVGPAYGVQWRKWQVPQTEDEFFPRAAIGEAVVTTECSIPGVPFQMSKPFDQIAKLINTLKTNPTDRRMIVTAWNPGDNDKMGLPPCHYSFQANTHIAHDGACRSRPVLWLPEKGGFHRNQSPGGCTCMMNTERELNLLVNMRSADIFLGVPFNIASYALLTHMLSWVTGMIPGELIFNFADLHVYENHVEQIRLQQSREPRPLPRLLFTRSPRSIDDFNYSDLNLEGYHPMDKIQGDVGV